MTFDPNQPRDPDGKWGSGMPSVIAAVDFSIGGTSGSMSAVAGDNVRVALGGASVDIPSTNGRRQMTDLVHQSDGVTEVSGPDGEPALRFRFGSHVEDVEDDYGGGSAASVEFVGKGKTVDMSAADVRKFSKAYERASASSRVEALSGPVDTYLDGNKFALRTKVSNSDPVTKAFDSPSWSRLSAAHSVVQDGYDDGGDYGPAGADVDELTVKTNAGRIVISRRGEGDDVTVSFSDEGSDDWFITHGLHHTDPVFGAFERLEESADELGFYNRNADGGAAMSGTAQPGRRTSRRPTTVHRALGYVDRASLAPDSPLRVVMASEGRMADGIDLRMSGAQLARYRGNPVLGYGHSYYGRENLPIGRVVPESLAVEGTRLVGDLEFDQEDPFAREVERKMRAGYLNAVSIGFEVKEWENEADSYWRGGVATGWEQTELSVVPVPMDAAALVTAGRGLVDEADRVMMRALIAEFGTERIALMLATLDKPADLEPPPDPKPPHAGVPEDSARGLLDAFTTTKESHA